MSGWCELRSIVEAPEEGTGDTELVDPLLDEVAGTCTDVTMVGLLLSEAEY